MISASDTARFFAKVNRNGPIPAHRPELGPCHVWTGGTARGYGHFKLDGKTVKAHRVAFFLAHGRWPEPNALHHCDNRPCCNDAHLFEGTIADNSADMVAKGRQGTPCGSRHGTRTKPHRRPRGERNGGAKLTEQKVWDILANNLLCRVTQKELAGRFRVSKQAVNNIVRGKNWRHLGL